MGLFSQIAKLTSGKTSTSTTSTSKTTGGFFSGIGAKIANATSSTSNSTAKKTNTSKKTNNNNNSNNNNNNNNNNQNTPEVSVKDSDIITWSGAGGVRFFVKPNKIQGVKDLNVKASVNSEEKENGGNKLPTRKTAGAIEITIKADLNAHLGADTQDLAMTIIDAARDGKTGYLYCYGKKLFPAAFMMMEAETSDIQMNSKGKWTKCTVTMKMKQSTKIDGTSATPPSTGGNKNNNNKKKIAGVAATVAAIAGATAAVANAVKDSLKNTNDAKKTSQNLLKQATQTKPPLVPRGQGAAFD